MDKHIYLRKSRRARGLRIIVRYDGQVVLTVPENMSQERAEKFLKEKKEWIREKLHYFTRLRERWGKAEPSFLLQKRRLGRKDYLKNKTRALEFVKERVFHFNKFYNFPFKKISVKNQKSRWGSCSRKGNLNFSYKIIYLPQELADYLIVHELCHLREFNHSKNFWKLVEKTIPEYLKLRKKLKNKRLF